jgi:hypothetical protein
MTRSRVTAVAGASALSGAAALWLGIAAHPQAVDAASTPGLLELTASLAASAWPSVALGSIFNLWHDVAAVAAAILCALAVWRFTNSVVASTAIGLVAAASPWTAPSLAPPDATALVVAAATLVALLGRGFAGAAVGLTLAGAIAPPMILPNAVLCWWTVRRKANDGRPWKAVFVAALSVIVAGALTLALPSLPGGADTGAFDAIARPVNTISAGLHPIVDVFWRVGPLGLALAAFGALALFPGTAARDESTRLRLSQTALAVAFAAAAGVAAFFAGAEPPRVMAPVALAVWLLIGLGISELVALPGGARGAAGIVVAAVLVGIHMEPRLNPPPTAADQRASLGHSALTERRFQQLLYQIPPDSELVSEDAVTDVLLRSLSRSIERSRSGLKVVPRVARDIAQALGSARVFALPRAQSELLARGVQFVAVPAAAGSGIAEAVKVVPCDLVTTAWRPSSSAVGMTRLAMVAGDDEARGPIVIYAGAPVPVEAGAIDWPRLALRGFDSRPYERANPELRQSLSGEVVSDGAPADHAAVNDAFAVRTELWRVPGAPRALIFELSSPAASVIAEQLARGTGPIQLCPVFPFTVNAIRK